MSADKRSVSTDALETLGMIISENEKRDAIHLGVEPVEAGESMKSGQHIGIGADGKAYLTGKSKVKALGIVDPFVGSVRKGERFWLIVYPRQITSLRHVWTHPDFPEQVENEELPTSAVDESKRYIADLADSVGISYGRLISGAEDWLETNDDRWGGQYIIGGAEMEGTYVPDEFWDHYEIVTGKTAPREQRGNFFSCSC